MANAERDLDPQVNYPALLAALICVAVPCVALGEGVRWAFGRLDVGWQHAPIWAHILTGFTSLEQAIGVGFLAYAWTLRQPVRNRAQELEPFLWASLKAVPLLYLAFHLAVSLNGLHTMNRLGILLGPFVYVLYPFISRAWAGALFRPTAASEAWFNGYILGILGIVSLALIAVLLVGFLYWLFARSGRFADQVLKPRHVTAVIGAALVGASLGVVATFALLLLSFRFLSLPALASMALQVPLAAASAVCTITLIAYVVEWWFANRSQSPDLRTWIVAMACGMPLIGLVERVVSMVLAWVVPVAATHANTLLIAGVSMSSLATQAAIGAAAGYVYGRRLGLPPLKEIQTPA